MLNLFLDILFCNIDWSVIVDIISIIANSILSVVAIVISVKTLKQSTNAIIESSRANIMFYIDTLTGEQSYLTIKNFGNSVGKVLNITITPEIRYSKLDNAYEKFKIPNFSNVMLAPNQSVKSWFDFKNYPDKIFNVTLKYKTLGKIYVENYVIDVSYINDIDYLSTYLPNIDSEKEALTRINNSILRLTERL